LNWKVYIIQCSDNSLYTGITLDVQRRFQQHACRQGAKYFRNRQPVKVVYSENCSNRRTASQREICIKQMGRAEKLKLIDSTSNDPDTKVQENKP
jgi:putative endonuclease